MTNRVPAYAVEPLKGFLAYTENVKTLLNVSMRSIAMTRNVPQMFEAFGLVSKGDAGWDENKHQAGLARAQRDALFAAKECDTGFPLLHEFTLVAMWGAFEAAIEDVIIGILCNEPELLRNEPFSKVRIPLAEFETLDKEERMRILLR